MIWAKTLDSVEPISNLANLPTYAFQFFFKNLGPFRRTFWLLTIGSILTTLTRFYTVYLLSQVITHIAELDLDTILWLYLPAWIVATAVAEVLDYFLRRYGEAFPSVYANHLAIRLYQSFFQLSFQRLFNISKERLNALVGKYCTNIEKFLGDWFWHTVRYLSKFIVVLIILGLQDLWVLLLNLIYMVGFLGLAFSISARFSPIARRYNEQLLDTRTVVDSFTLNLNTVRRLAIKDFFIDTYKNFTRRNWGRLQEVQDFHATRWLVQLNLFNFLYIGTLVYGIVQVKQGSLPLGYLVLIKWAFDELWHILVYAIEYYVSLVQQREDAIILRREFTELFGDGPLLELGSALNGWQEISLKNVALSFAKENAENREVTISVPNLAIKAGDKVGIIGESGAGKTTILHALLNVLDFQGSYTIDGADFKGHEFSARQVTVIGNADPLFKLSLIDNVKLGRNIPPDTLERILRGVRVDKIPVDLNSLVGTVDFNLSAGQEQRIRLARGLCQDSALVLLDEPFNGIDRATKQEIIEFLKVYLADRTVILVTHNQDELQLVDHIYHLKNGVLEKGNL